MQIQFSKIVQSSSRILHFVDFMNNRPAQKKNWKMMANHTLLWNQWWKTKKYFGAPLNKTGCPLSVLAHTDHLWGKFSTDLESYNVESVVLARLSISPCIQSQSSRTCNVSEVWAFWVQETFLSASANKIDFNVWCFYNWSALLYSSSYGYLVSYNLFYWKSLCLNAATVIEWSLTTCTLLM